MSHRLHRTLRRIVRWCRSGVGREGAGLKRGVVATAPAGPILEPLEQRLLLSADRAWTVMVFLNGDNDLEQAAIDEFQEIATVGSTDSVAVVSQLDRSPRSNGYLGYSTDFGNWSCGRRGLIEKGDRPEDDWGWCVGEPNMGDTQALAGFVEWAVLNYPAEHYGLVLWDHGFGWQGVSEDESSDGDFLHTSELSEALSEAGHGPLDIVLLDCCLGAMTEIAWQLHGLSDVMVASQENMILDGFAYDTMLTSLTLHPEWTAEQWAGDIVDSYEREYRGAGRGWYGLDTLSAVDLGSLAGSDGLVRSLSQFAETMILKADNDDYEALQGHRQGVSTYGYDFDTGQEPGYVDIGGFLQRVVSDASLSSAIRAAADEALSSYATSILANFSDDMAASSGLSLYFPWPGEGDPLDAAYRSELALTADTLWDDFLESLAVPPGHQLAVGLSAEDDTGLPGDGITQDAQPWLEGVTSPGLVVRAEVDGANEMGPVIAGADGAFEFRPAQPLGEGEHHITVTAEDEWGRTCSAELDLVVDTTVNAPQIETTGIESPLTMASLSMTGQAEPDAAVLLQVNDDRLITAVADEQGHWSVLLEALTDGPYTIVAQAEDIAGNRSSWSPPLSFLVDTAAPTVAAVSPEAMVKAQRVSQLTVSFSEPMVLDGLDGGSFQLLAAGEDGAFQPGDDPVALGPLLVSDDSRQITLTVQGGGDLPPGRYRFSINADAELVDLAGNELVDDSGTDQLRFLYDFEIIAMPVPLDSRGIAYQDADGSRVTLRIINGEGEASFAGEDMALTSPAYGSQVVEGRSLELGRLVLTESTTDTMLMIQVSGGDGKTVINGFEADSLGLLSGHSVLLAGETRFHGGLKTLMIAGMKDHASLVTEQSVPSGTMLQLGEVGEGGQLDLAGTLRLLRARHYHSGRVSADTIETIMAGETTAALHIEARQGHLGMLQAKGDWSGEVTSAESVDRVFLRDGAFRGTIRAGHHVGMVSVPAMEHALLSAAGNINQVIVQGDILDSYLLAGYDIGPDAKVGGGDDPSLVATTGGDLRLLLSTGRFARSYVCAGVLPYTNMTKATLPDGNSHVESDGTIGTVILGSVDYVNAEEPFGFFAASGVKPFYISGKVAQSRYQFTIQEFAEL